jgi:hypothetical protein
LPEAFSHGWAGIVTTHALSGETEQEKSIRVNSSNKGIFIFMPLYTRKVQEIFQLSGKKFDFILLLLLSGGKWMGFEDMEDL